MEHDKASSTSLGRQVVHTLRRMFISGVLVTVPLIVTVAVLHFLFRQVDGVLSPLVHRVFGYSVPGMGLVATLLLIMLFGVLGRNVIGLRLVALSESLIARMPFARTIYGAAKQLVEAVTSKEHRRFNRVVLIEYPRRGMFSLGFASGRPRLSKNGESRELVAVFVPSTPTPVTGFVTMLPPEDVTYLTMTPEEAIKFLVSGGLAAPELMARATPESPLVEMS